MDKSTSESVFVVYVAQIFHGFSQKVHTVFRTVCGHEFAGTVDVCGSEVDGIGAGDKVVVFPLLWCGRCAACERENMFNVATTITSDHEVTVRLQNMLST